MKSVELNFDLEHPVRPGAIRVEGLGGDILLQSARWFTRIRWVSVGVLFAFGVLNQGFPEVLVQLSLVPVAWWPWTLAGGLAGLNLIFIFLLRPAREPIPYLFVVTCTWFQILADLMILTIFVHEVGSTDTFIVFAYLFHIVMTCIFFVPRDSFLVTVLSAVLFVGCWALETIGILARHSIVAAPPSQLLTPIALINVVSAVFIWFVVWYLTSTISKAVRERDRKLATANELLIAADREKNLLMLRTVHDLKAPFSGIELNIEMLKMQDWDALPPTAHTIINAIEVRSATLRERIKDILLLGELRDSTCQADLDEAVDMYDLLNAVIADLSAKADQRKVSVCLSARKESVISNRKQLSMLFANLIANAIVYSHENGQVEVTATRTPAGVSVKVSDHGIGISEKAMPHIFEEYFRSPEAAQFNLLSTGLGLAIVKHIAQNIALKVSVTSEQGTGTTFEVLVPCNRSRGPWHES
ncbi:MAG: HAMP domain-containing sensor histidine kinase [bacterium]